jgi:hypothetical protein
VVCTPARSADLVAAEPPQIAIMPTSTIVKLNVLIIQALLEV